MDTEVFRWRVRRELKKRFEKTARLRNVSVSAALEMAVRDWLRKNETQAASDEGKQAKARAEASRWIGAIHGRNPRRAETAREGIRSRLRRRYSR